LISMRDFISFLFSIQATSKCLRIYAVSFYTVFSGWIKARTLGNNSLLYLILPANRQRPLGHGYVGGYFLIKD
jgi:hypothetical protein